MRAAATPGKSRGNPRPPMPAAWYDSPGGVPTPCPLPFSNGRRPMAMQDNVRLETVTAPRPLAVVRRRATCKQLPQVVPAACGLVWGIIRARQVKGAGRHVAVYLDDRINLEVGVELETPFAGDGEVVGSALPAGTVATTVHFGPYQRLHAAHQAIRDWCASHGHTPAGPNWEVYGHWVEAWNTNPDAIRTDVYYLLRPGVPPTG